MERNEIEMDYLNKSVFVFIDGECFDCVDQMIRRGYCLFPHFVCSTSNLCLECIIRHIMTNSFYILWPSRFHWQW